MYSIMKRKSKITESWLVQSRHEVILKVLMTAGHTNHAIVMFFIPSSVMSFHCFSITAMLSSDREIDEMDDLTKNATLNVSRYFLNGC